MRYHVSNIRQAILLVALCCSAVLPLGAATVDTRPKGLLVDKVDAGGPAEKAGIVVNDVLTSVDGSALETVTDIMAALSHHKPGDSLRLTIRKADGSAGADVTLVLGASPDDSSRPYMGLSIFSVFLLVPEGQGRPKTVQPPTPSV
jgi:S1-C subfamily serine protease